MKQSSVYTKNKNKPANRPQIPFNPKSCIFSINEKSFFSELMHCILYNSERGKKKKFSFFTLQKTVLY